LDTLSVVMACLKLLNLDEGVIRQTMEQMRQPNYELRSPRFNTDYRRMVLVVLSKLRSLAASRTGEASQFISDFLRDQDCLRTSSEIVDVIVDLANVDERTADDAREVEYTNKPGVEQVHQNMQELMGTALSMATYTNVYG